MIKLKRCFNSNVSTESAVSNVPYTLEFIAKLTHGTIRSYKEMIGETGLESWEDLSEDMKKSTLVGVAFIVKNRDVTPKETHEKWVEERTCEGWSFGTVKDEVTKKHPCLLEYEKMPVEHRMKDHIFRAVILSVLDSLEENQKLDISTECGCESFSAGLVF